jgi:hypothetical protein
LTVNPSLRWSISAWYGYVKSPEVLHPDESLHRYGVAALTTRPFGRRGQWASAVIWGANDPIGSGQPSNSVVLESNLDFDGTNVIFGRAEHVPKSAAELVIPAVPPPTAYDIGALAVGYLRAVGTIAGFAAGIGVRGSVNFVSRRLETVYGGRTPAGAAVYLRLRPAAAH